MRLQAGSAAGQQQPLHRRRRRRRRGNPNTQECNGHHGLWAAASSNVLVTE